MLKLQVSGQATQFLVVTRMAWDFQPWRSGVQVLQGLQS